MAETKMQSLQVSPSAQSGAPVVQVSAKCWRDVLQAAWMFPVLKAMRETTILAVTDEDITSAAEQVRQVFGTRVVRVSGSNMRAYYDRVTESEAAVWAERWRKGARHAHDLSPDLMTDNARMYLAISRLMSHAHADIVAVDCPTLRNQQGNVPLPCMSHFQINNDGLTAVCTSDLNAVCSHALLRTISAHPGILTHVTGGTPGKGVTLSHSACTNRLFGPTGATNPYVLRRAEQEKHTVYVQSLLPKQEQMTLVNMDLTKRQARIAGVESLATPDVRDKCRTCLLAKTSDDLVSAGQNPERPSAAILGAYCKRATFAVKLARLEPTGCADAA